MTAFRALCEGACGRILRTGWATQPLSLTVVEADVWDQGASVDGPPGLQPQAASSCGGEKMHLFLVSHEPIM